MFTADIRKIIEKFGVHTTGLLDRAAGFCLTRTHYQIAMEHFLLKAIEDGGGDVLVILRHFGVDAGALQAALLRDLEGFRSGNEAKPSFSPTFLEQVERAWIWASVNFGDSKIRSGYLLLALLNHAEHLSAFDYGRILMTINAQELASRFHDITRASKESTQVAKPRQAVDGALELSEDSYLARYTTDFTALARAGKIDPVLRRDREIREIVGILARRRKNNPICVGDPGVGKSAVVEGLALRVIENDVPDLLRGIAILGLDIGMLQAGAGVKGEFENRLKGVIDEVKASPTPIVLFIDEAHTLIGAGGPAGGADAANLLKPALARGELRTIASTTWSEYKKYFEKDAALARRFQLVKIDEPSVEHAIDIVRGIKEKYEAAHGVIIDDAAVVESVKLSDRYISGRQLPDKAIDLLDTACARIRIHLSSKPAVLDDVERDIGALERAIAALSNVDTPSEEQNEKLDECKQRQAALKERQVALEEQWKREQALVRDVLAHKQKADKEKEAATRIALADVQSDGGLIHPQVGRETICSVVTDWTGIPLSRMIADEASTVLNLETSLRARIKGQDWAMEVLGRTIRASKAGIKPKETPVGVCLLVGPSGVGKTETALAIADLLFGGERFVTTINMSEYQEKHTVSRLIGSPPGYVGYGEGGYLTEALRRSPYSLVLIDETEKAHPDVLNLFYQVFDKGMLSDAEGREIDCRNALFLLTSNLATAKITKLGESPVRPEMDELIALIRPELSAFFKPALLARMTIVPYLTLPKDVLEQIVVLKLDKLGQRIFEAHRAEFHYERQVVDELVSRCNEVESGARNIDQIIAQFIMPALSNEILAALSRTQKVGTLALALENGCFVGTVSGERKSTAIIER
jgi:type VI secretion system protein VasG